MCPQVLPRTLLCSDSLRDGRVAAEWLQCGDLSHGQPPLYLARILQGGLGPSSARLTLGDTVETSVLTKHMSFDPLIPRQRT